MMETRRTGGRSGAGLLSVNATLLTSLGLGCSASSFIPSQAARCSSSSEAGNQ